MLDFVFATADEICAELGSRLKAARLVQGMQQVELAARAGVSRGTVSTLESSGQSTLASIVRVAQALNLVDELQDLFKLQIRTIAEMERSEQGKRKRVSRKRRSEGSTS